MAKHEWVVIEESEELFFYTNKKISVTIEECKFCYVQRYGPFGEPGSHYFHEYYDYDGHHIYAPSCIELPIKLEALERSSAELKNRYWFAINWVRELYACGDIDFFRPYFFSGYKKIIPSPSGQTRRDLYKIMCKWIDDAFIEQYKKESLGES